MRRKQDLDKDEICLENERWLSRIKPRFRTDAEAECWLSRESGRTGFEILVSCLGRPINKNSVLEWLRVSRLDDIQTNLKKRRLKVRNGFSKRRRREREEELSIVSKTEDSG